MGEALPVFLGLAIGFAGRGYTGPAWAVAALVGGAACAAANGELALGMWPAAIDACLVAAFALLARRMSGVALSRSR